MTTDLRLALKALIVEACDKDCAPESITDEELLFGPEAPLQLDSLDALQVSMAIKKTYGKRGETVLARNFAAVCPTARKPAACCPASPTWQNTSRPGWPAAHDASGFAAQYASGFHRRNCPALRPRRFAGHRRQRAVEWRMQRRAPKDRRTRVSVFFPAARRSRLDAPRRTGRGGRQAGAPRPRSSSPHPPFRSAISSNSARRSNCRWPTPRSADKLPNGWP